MSEVDPNQDRFTTPAKALQRVRQEETFPNTNVERLEIHFFPSGDVTWRVWEPRSDEAIGGHIQGSDLE